MRGSSRKKVLIVAGVFPPEPIVSANIYFDLACELGKDYDVTVIRPRPSRPLGFSFDEPDFENYPFRVVTLNSYICPASKLTGRYRESRSMGKAAVKFLKSHRGEFDFIYNDPWQIFGINMVAKEAIRQGIPYVVPVQDVYPESLTSKLPRIPVLRKIVQTLLLPIDRFNLSHAAAVHTISDKMVRHLSHTRGIAPERFICVRNWQNEKAFLDSRYSIPHETCGDRRFTFMYLGNVGFLAGLETVIDAFASAGIAGTRLVIAGSGAARKGLEEKASAMGLENVEFMDVPSRKVPEVQSSADVMVLPVKKGYAMTSIPSKLPAYWFSAKPVLASVDRDSDTAWCIINSDGGWVVDPENREALASKMTELASMPIEVIHHKGERGYDFAMTKLSKKENLTVLADRIRKIINE